MRTSKTVNGITTNYYVSGTQILAEETSGNITVYLYDSEGAPLGMQYHGANYAANVWDVFWYERNIFGDIVAVYDEAGTLLATYTYDAYGVASTLYYNGGSNTRAFYNPFRYRGYYYDRDLSLYYLSTRYYDCRTGRFVSPDSYISTGQGLTGYNMYAYCGDNPVMRVDPTGEAWYHWVIGAAVVAVAAVATVVTCGGFAAAATAVCLVGNGLAAATTASTIAAGAFIGSSIAYGSAALIAASTSNSIDEFNDQGNWDTVIGTALGGLSGAYDGYSMSKAQTSTNSLTNNSRGSTGRTVPANLSEQLAMEQVKSNPSAGTPLTKISLNDPRWPSSEGWIKMQQIVPTSKGNINIHYVYNQKLGIFDDFKFKP